MLKNFDNNCGVLDGTDGSAIWDSIVIYIVMDVIIEDIDEDGQLEAIYGGIYRDDTGVVFVRNALDGVLEWSYNIGPVDHSNGNILLRAVMNGDTTQWDNRPYHTGGIWTLNKFAFQYGRIEVRAKLDPAYGAWPAIWMIPTKKIYKDYRYRSGCICPCFSSHSICIPDTV